MSIIKIFSGITSLCKSFLPTTLLTLSGLKEVLKSAAKSAVKEVEESFLDAAASSELSEETISKMKTAAAIACAIEQIRSQGALGKILVLFAKSTIEAAINEIKK